MHFNQNTFFQLYRVNDHGGQHGICVKILVQDLSPENDQIWKWYSGLYHQNYSISKLFMLFRMVAFWSGHWRAKLA